MGQGELFFLDPWVKGNFFFFLDQWVKAEVLKDMGHET